MIKKTCEKEDHKGAPSEGGGASSVHWTEVAAAAVPLPTTSALPGWPRLRATGLRTGRLDSLVQAPPLPCPSHFSAGRDEGLAAVHGAHEAVGTQAHCKGKWRRRGIAPSVPSAEPRLLERRAPRTTATWLPPHGRTRTHASLPTASTPRNMGPRFNEPANQRRAGRAAWDAHAAVECLASYCPPPVRLPRTRRAVRCCVAGATAAEGRTFRCRWRADRQTRGKSSTGGQTAGPVSLKPPSAPVRVGRCAPASPPAWAGPTPR